MPSIQGIVWRGIKPVVKPWMMSRFCSGKLPSFNWNTWKNLSKDFWTSLDHHLIQQGEILAVDEIQNRHVLQNIITREDLENVWAASPATILFIWKQLHLVQPKTIVEMGSGVSTRLFSFYAKQQELKGRRVPRIYSFDHDEHWLQLTDNRLKEFGLNQFVKLTYAPLSPFSWNGHPDTCYEIPSGILMELDRSIDFFMIDGPPKDVGRSGTLPRLSNHLADGARIFLDDARRPGEIAAVDLWINEYTGFMSQVRGRPTIRGMIDFQWQVA